MKENELFNAWMSLTKYHNRLLKAMDYTLKNRFQLGMKEFYLMYYLLHSEHKQMRLSALVPKVELSHSALSRLVKRLEYHPMGALVQRQSVEQDKRSVDIFLLDQGEQAVKEMQSLIQESLQSQISDKDMRNMKRLIE